MESSREKSFRLVVMALSVLINLILIRLNLFFSFLPNPFYLDTVGTIFASRILGLQAGLLVASVSAILNQLADPFALAYLPTNWASAIVAYLIYNKGGRRLNIFLKAGLVSLFSSIIGALITAYIFEGVTSAGSSVILRFFHLALGMDLSLVALIVQLSTEFLDKLVVLTAVEAIIRSLPSNIMIKLKKPNSTS